MSWWKRHMFLMAMLHQRACTIILFRTPPALYLPLSLPGHIIFSSSFGYVSTLSRVNCATSCIPDNNARNWGRFSVLAARVWLWNIHIYNWEESGREKNPTSFGWFVEWAQPYTFRYEVIRNNEPPGLPPSLPGDIEHAQVKLAMKARTHYG